ncbi:toll/interleukin-1 receptor domain-containing protein [Pseudonocardia sp. ICBG1142]|uniref:toll/interleukin-1 receptor domain-containing protein n=1 Tax=Pseudonocardia sp. ICBG1142 TaxID=2846760 RepID=UPI001CF6508C|nr:toll/interleukin-1 receptor domain-containing protein [Pseudonocardia sp. ICBG1142]
MADTPVNPASSVRANVFLSYASADYGIASEIRAALRKRGVSVFDDKNLRAGGYWAGQLQSALAAADVVLVVVSANLVNSSSVNQEWITALAQRKPVVPIVVEQGVEVPAILASYVGMDISDPGTRGGKLEQLAQQLSVVPSHTADTQAEAVDSAERLLIESRAAWNAELKMRSL